MEIRQRRVDTTLQIDLSGEINESGAAELKQVFNALDLEGITRIVLDFQGVDWIGSSGLGKLLMLYKRIAASGGEIAIINASDEVRALLREVNLHTLFHL